MYVYACVCACAQACVWIDTAWLSIPHDIIIHACMDYSILNTVDSTEDDAVWEGTVIKNFKVINCYCHVMTRSSKVQLMGSRHYISNRVYNLCLV